MKKLISIDDDIFERMEAIREKFHIKSMQPVLDIVISMGLEAFETLLNPPVEEKVYIWPWYPQYPQYPMYDQGTAVTWSYDTDLGQWKFESGCGSWSISLGTGQQYGVNYNVNYNANQASIKE